MQLGMKSIPRRFVPLLMDKGLPQAFSDAGTSLSKAPSGRQIEKSGRSCYNQSSGLWCSPAAVVCQADRGRFYPGRVKEELGGAGKASRLWSEHE